jgi:hypothetical protein
MRAVIRLTQIYERGERARARSSRFPFRGLGGFDRNALRLNLRQLRDCDLKNAICLLCFDGSRLGTLRQREATQEGSGNALNALVAACIVTLFRLALTAYGQNAFFRGDFDVFGIHTR